MARLTRVEQRARTRTLLVQAAAGLFAEQGFDATKNEQIAEAAGFSKGAFYSNFKSKDEIAIAVLDVLRETARGRIVQSVAEHQGDQASMLAAIRDALVTNNENRVLSMLRPEVLMRSARDAEFRRTAVAFFQDWRAADSGIVASVFEGLGRARPASPQLIADISLSVIIGSQLLTHAGLGCPPLSQLLDFLLPRLLGSPPEPMSPMPKRPARRGRTGPSRAGKPTPGSAPTNGRPSRRPKSYANRRPARS